MRWELVVSLSAVILSIVALVICRVVSWIWEVEGDA